MTIFNTSKPKTLNFSVNCRVTPIPIQYILKYFPDIISLTLTLTSDSDDNNLRQ